MDGQFGRELPGQEGDAQAIARIRNPYFRAVYTEVTDQVKSGAPIVGALFWQWLRDDRLQAPNANSIKTGDSTFSKCAFCLSIKFDVRVHLQAHEQQSQRFSKIYSPF